MKKKTKAKTSQKQQSYLNQGLHRSSEPNEASIREHAYSIYEKANYCDGHDLEHWVEATAQLKSRVAESQSVS